MVTFEDDVLLWWIENEERIRNKVYEIETTAAKAIWVERVNNIWCEFIYEKKNIIEGKEKFIISIPIGDHEYYKKQLA